MRLAVKPLALPSYTCGCGGTGCAFRVLWHIQQLTRVITPPSSIADPGKYTGACSLTKYAKMLFISKGTPSRCSSVR